MIARSLKAFLAVAAAIFAVPSFAHEVSCEKTVGVVVPMPVGFGFLAEPTSTATIDHYPALVGFSIRVTNLAPEPSILTGTWDSLADVPGATVLGATLDGASIPVGGALQRLVVVPVSSYEACLALGGEPAHLACDASALENRFVATHDAGSAECRARLVCKPESCTPPQWTGVRHIEHTGSADGESVAVASDGHVVVSGEAANERSHDAMLATLDPTGALESLAQWGPVTFAEAYAVRIDAQGRRIVAGEYSEPGFDGYTDVFVRSLSPTGELLWEQLIADVGFGPPPVTRPSLAVDAASNIYVAYTSNDGNPLGVKAVKLSPEGGRMWASTTGIGYRGAVGGIAVTPDGAVFLTGSAAGTGVDVPPTHVFVARLDPTNGPAWYREFASGQDDVPTGIAVDAAGNAVIVGYTDGTLDPSGPPPVPHARSAFALALDASGGLRWIRQLAPASAFPTAVPSDVALDAAGAAWMAGYTFGGLPGTGLPESSSGYGFVARYDAGGTLLWAREFADSELRGVATDCAGYGVATGVNSTQAIPENAPVIRLAPDGSN